MTKAEHVAKAEANQVFADSLGAGSQSAIDWSITALFYVAVHLVQAYFAARGSSYVTHKTRHSAIRRDAAIGAAYDDYRELESLSREARYEAPSLTAAQVKYVQGCLQGVRNIIGPLI